MESQPSRNLIRLPQPQRSDSAENSSLVREWVLRFAVNAGQTLTPEQASSIVALWSDDFAGIPVNQLRAAFMSCMRSHRFKTIPTVGDVRQHLKRAESNSAGEKASLKFQQVRDSIRLHYNPDIPWRGPKISERTRRAINAAGGMAYLSECIGTDLVFARQRFIEAWLRWDELNQDEYLLQDGEVKKLLADLAETKALPEAAISMHSLEEQKRILREKGFLPEPQPAAEVSA